MKTTKTTVWRSGQTGFVVKCDVTGKVLHGPSNKEEARRRRELETEEGADRRFLLVEVDQVIEPGADASAHVRMHLRDP